MSKRISPEDRVIGYFMTQPYAAAVQMLATVRAIVRARGEEPSTPTVAKPTPAKRRARKPAAPKPAPTSTTPATSGAHGYNTSVTQGEEIAS